MASASTICIDNFIGHPIARNVTLFRVGRTQLSPNQNSKLRQLIVRKRMEFNWSLTRMAKEIGVSQPSLSEAMDVRKPGGFSYETALRFCRKFLKQENIEEALGQREDEPSPAAETSREKAVRMAKDAEFKQTAIDAAMAELADARYDDRPPDFYYQRIREEHIRQVDAYYAGIQEMAKESPLGKKPKKKVERAAEEAPASVGRRHRKKLVNE